VCSGHARKRWPRPRGKATHDDSMATWSRRASRRQVRDGRSRASRLLELSIDRIDRIDGRSTRWFHHRRGGAPATRRRQPTRDGAGVDRATHGLDVTIKDAIADEGIRSKGGAARVDATTSPSATPGPSAQLKGGGRDRCIRQDQRPGGSRPAELQRVFGTTNKPVGTSDG